MTGNITRQPDNKPDRYHTGQVFIDSRGDYIRIYKIEDGTVYFESNFNGEWHHYGSEKIDQMGRREWIPVNENIEDFEQRALAIFLGLEQIKDDDDEISQETAIMKADSKALVEEAMRSVQEKMNLVEAARRVIERKTDAMRWMVSRMREKIERLNKIILVFELYLGVYEEIVQIQDGPAALSKTPISIRQLVLYMDEEVGDPREKTSGQRGIDWQSIEDFDSWVLKNYERVIPEEKGVVALKPSRQHRWYDADPWFNAAANAKNQKTYLLIRNGQKFYRIWTDTSMGSLLFPTTDESDAIRRLLDEGYGFEKRDAEDKQYVFVRNAMILQGLLDRTDILQPIPHRINLMNPDTYGGLVDFIRDGEYTLSDGRPRFFDWLKSINDKLQPGSRVYVAFGAQYTDTYYTAKDHKHRFITYYSDYNTPPLPEWGVYQLSLTDTEVGDYDLVPGDVFKSPMTGEEQQTYRRVSVERRRLRIQYNPGDTVGDTGWSWDAYDPHPRKNRITFLINKDDKFIINVDQIDQSDIDYYLDNRIDRGKYLNMIPLLWGVRDFVIAEREKEVHFVKLVAGRLGVDEAQVWEAVDWWKYRNQWKRSIRDDDAKALRMIEKRIRREIR